MGDVWSGVLCMEVHGCIWDTDLVAGVKVKYSDLPSLSNKHKFTETEGTNQEHYTLINNQ